MKAPMRVLLLSSLVCLRFSADEYVVISNKNAHNLSTKQIKAIYLKKLIIVNDVSMVPVNLDSGDELRDKFEQEILGMNSSQLKKYWTQQHYLGHRPPISLKSQESVKRFIKNVDGSVGYLETSNLDDNIKTLYTWRDEPDNTYEYQYKLGDGTQIGSLPIYIGGYLSIDYRHMNGERRYRIDDLAVLSYGNYDNFSYMAEFEHKAFFAKTYVNGSSRSENNSKLHTERLYADYKRDEHYAFRLGKYNSPIGFWNLLPVNVLRDTTSVPMSSFILFPQFTTGFDASYSSLNGGELKIDLMAQRNKGFDDEYNNYKIDEHYAFGIAYEKDDYALKLNGGRFTKTDAAATAKDFNYALLSAKCDTDKYQIMGELGSQSSSDQTTTPYAGYLQGLYRVTPKHIAVLRAEAYKDNVANAKDKIAILGYTYRPLYPVALKAEYQIHSNHNEDQTLLSLSVMF